MCEGYDPALDGFYLVHGNDAIRKIFPFVTTRANVMLHARRCGWLNAQGLGQAMLQEAKDGVNGAQMTFLHASVKDLDVVDGDVVCVRAEGHDGVEVALPCDAFVNAAGAWMQNVNDLLTTEPLPIINEA